LVFSGKILSRNAITCNLSDSAPIGTPCAEKIFASNIQRDSATLLRGRRPSPQLTSINFSRKENTNMKIKTKVKAGTTNGTIHVGG
jgi:hypothetical protein